jgi:lipoate-protein ligase A
MEIVNYLPDTPEEQIALDELLLQKAEADELGETLHLWSAKDYFVVLSRAGKIAEDCFQERCRQDNAKILRRISGGGTVLQGPGCLNYSIILAYESDKRYKSIKSSYMVILGKISYVMRAKGFDVQFFPVSDLALSGKKISGNAQARKKRYFLHHGTFLYNFDIEKVSHYLKYPPKEPEYREGRSHKDFLTNIPMSEKELKELIIGMFPYAENIWKPTKKDIKLLEDLASSKYKSREWTYAF